MTNQYQSQPLSEEEQALAAGYVLGDLSDEEQQQMGTLLAERPEMIQAVNALSASLRSLPHGLPMVDPPPQLEASIITAYTNEYPAELKTVADVLDVMADGLETATDGLETVTDGLETVTDGLETVTDGLETAADGLTVADGGRSLTPATPSTSPTTLATPNSSSISWSKLIAGITTLAALFFGVNNMQLRGQLAQSLDQNTETASAVNILQQPNSRLISLEGTADIETAGGTLLFAAGQWQEVVVSMSNLPPLPVNEVYRMWLTLENGAVIFCGEFNTNPDGTIVVQLNPDEVPPQGVKATGLYVTQAAKSTAPNATGTPIMVGEI